ncbi:hypothetical protein ACFL16_03225, partial [Patescibacteria group bacterium]
SEEKETTIKQIEKIIDKRIREKNTALEKHPLIFGIIVTFGLVAVIAGTEGIINQVPLLHENPYILIIIGVTILISTGAAYRLIEG